MRVYHSQNHKSSVEQSETLHENKARINHGKSVFQSHKFPSNAIVVFAHEHTLRMYIRFNKKHRKFQKGHVNSKINISR